MIIRKLAEALRTQNWFTVALEILIVVIGIFIGLQVDDWNSSRKERSEERAYLERLLVQMHKNQAELTKLGPLLAERMEAVNFALAALDGDPQEIDAQGFMVAIGKTMNLWVINLQTDVYEELVSTGKLNLISAITLREELAAYLAEIDSMNKVDSIGTFDFFHTNYVPYLLGHLDMQKIFDGWNTERMRGMHRSELPDPTILRIERSHPLKIQFRNNLIYLYSTLAWMKYLQEKFLDQTNRLETLIRSELE